METTIINAIINAIIIIITLLVIIVSTVIRRQKPTDKQLKKLQQSLNESDAKANAHFGLDWHHDALEEFKKEKMHISGFISLLSGLILVVLFVLSCVWIPFSTTNIIVICISAIVLIVNGLIIFAENKVVAIVTLIIILSVGMVFLYKIEAMLTYDPLAYKYLCAIIAFCGIGLFVARK